MRQLVCFFVGSRELAAPIEVVRETVDLRPITPMFHTPPAICGIANLRGEILAVVDPAVLLGLPRSRRDPSARILVVEPDDRTAGLLVDGLGPIRTVDDDALAPPPPSLPAAIAALIEGVVPLADHPLPVISVERLLGAPELAEVARPPRDPPPLPDAAPPSPQGS